MSKRTDVIEEIFEDMENFNKLIKLKQELKDRLEGYELVIVDNKLIMVRV